MSRAEFYLVGAVRGGHCDFERLAAMLPTDEYETVASRYIYAGTSLTSPDSNYPGTVSDTKRLIPLLGHAAENAGEKVVRVEPYRIPLKKGFIEFRQMTKWGEYEFNGHIGHWTVEARRVKESSLKVWTQAAVRLFKDMKTVNFVVLKDYDSQSRTEKEMEYTPLFHIERGKLGADKFITLMELATWGWNVRADTFREQFGPDWQRISLYDLECLLK